MAGAGLPTEAAEPGRMLRVGPGAALAVFPVKDGSEHVSALGQGALFCGTGASQVAGACGNGDATAPGWLAASACSTRGFDAMETGCISLVLGWRMVHDQIAIMLPSRATKMHDMGSAALPLRF